MHTCNLRATPAASKSNFIQWCDKIVEDACHESVIVVNPRREKIGGCYEKLSDSQMSRILAVFSNLSVWSEQCKVSGCTAGKLLAVTGSQSRMEIVQHFVRPFVSSH